MAILSNNYCSPRVEEFPATEATDLHRAGNCFPSRTRGAGSTPAVEAGFSKLHEFANLNLG